MNEISFCPKCGCKAVQTLNGCQWLCPECKFTLYLDMAAAVGLLLHCRGSLLLFTRTKEPGKGKCGIPGGFVNAAESLEEACRRECAEEIGIAPPPFSYLCSFPNVYPYKGISYNTCDVFFAAEYSGAPEELLRSLKTVDGEASDCKLVPLAELDLDDLAFDSHKKAVQILRAKLERRG